MNITASELNELVLNAYEKGKSECKVNEVKGEIFEYNGRVCYDIADIVECIINRIEEFAEAKSPWNTKYDGISEKDKLVYEISKRIKYEFLTPLRPPMPKVVRKGEINYG